jgi:hypothetical protein
MATLRVNTILSDAVLVSRESARELTEAIEALLDQHPDSTVAVDFAGVAGVAPSFLDELLTVFESILGKRGCARSELIVANPPTRLSSKFEAVARSHNLSAQPRDDGTWVLISALDPSH